jgi:pseudouridine synthase
MSMMRLQKWLSAAGVCSRRQGESLINQGRVSVNGIQVLTLGTKIDPARDKVEVDGRPVGRIGQMIYIALNKPEGYVTSCRHSGEKVVVELVDIPQRIYPIGRLDKDSTGLLLLTNDGRLHHHLSHPSFDHEKEYEVVVDRPIAEEALQSMAAGLVLEGSRTRPARVSRRSAKKFRIVLQEGRNRQIRRMTAHLGYRVIQLKRIRMANVRLGSLPVGGWRHLSQVERRKLLKGLDL